MCGIIGVFNHLNAYSIVLDGLKTMQERGRDGYGFYDGKQVISDVELSKLPKGNSSKNVLGHCLHAIVKNIKQPLKQNGVLVINCEIYNWEELCKKHNIKAKNDAELVLKLFDKLSIAAIKEFDGPYALAYQTKEKVILARDLIGEKPLWTVKTKDSFAFASEKKALLKQGFINIEELNPRTVLEYNLKTGKIIESRRDFFEITPETKKEKEEIKKELSGLIINSVAKRVPDRKVGVLFSGGIDSVVIAKTLKSLGVNFTCYTAALKEKGVKKSDDLIWARKASREIGFKLKVKTVSLDEVDSYLKKIIPLIEDSNVVKAGVSLPFFIACERAKEDGVKVIFSGLGSEELFAGYKRHEKSHELNKECLHGLLQLHERDLYRDDVITMANNIELRLPYLDLELAAYSLKIPGKYKITHEKKAILREVAEEIFDIPKHFAWRPKKAAQYGSGFDKAIDKLSRRKNFNFKSDYLNTFLNRPNKKLGVLFSSGKDSTYATYIMKKRNYEISCLITIKSENKDSFMFHTPNIDLASLQAKSMGYPLVEQKTSGKKETELLDLKKAIQKAKEKYHIEGVVTGALFSNYQRERIEKICDELALPVFSPLWHKDQETEMRELLKEKFEFILSSVAAYGLDKSWLGKIITEKEIEKLVLLNKKYKLNVAGEGGEFESLVIDCPIFSKKLIINESEIIEENENTAKLIVKNATLEDKK